MARRILISLVVLLAIGAIFSLSLRRRESVLYGHAWARPTYEETFYTLKRECSFSKELPDGRTQFVWYGSDKKADGITRTLILPYKSPSDITETR